MAIHMPWCLWLYALDGENNRRFLTIPIFIILQCGFYCVLRNLTEYQRRLYAHHTIDVSVWVSFFVDAYTKKRKLFFNKNYRCGFSTKGKGGKSYGVK